MKDTHTSNVGITLSRVLSRNAPFVVFNKGVSGALLGCLFFVTVMFLSPFTMPLSVEAAAAKITAIEVADNVVRVDATENLQYKIDNTDPFNITIDIDNAELANPQDKPFTSKKGLISEIRAAHAKGDIKKTRINMILNAPAEVDASVKDKSLFITIAKNYPLSSEKETYALADTKKTVISEPSTNLKPSDKTLQPATEIVALFLDRTEKGAELVLKGNGAMPDPVVYKLDDSIIIEIDGVAMNAYIPMTMISPIKKISHKKDKNVIKILVEIEKEESSSYLKKDKDIITDVLATNDEIVLIIGTVSYEGKEKDKFEGSIDIDYSNADVKSVLQSIAIKAGYNWVIDENVSASVTLKQSNINWKEAIKLIEGLADVQVFIDEPSKTLKVKKSELSKLGVPKEGDLVSFDFQDADLSSVIMLLSEVSGFNIIIHPEIKDIKYKVNTKLKNVTWQKALEKIVKLLGLEYSVDDTDRLIVIAPIETINKIEEARQKTRDARAKAYEATSKLYTERAKIAQEKIKAMMSEQKVTKIIRLKYLTPSEAQKHITQLNIFKGITSKVDTKQEGSAKSESVKTEITKEAIDAEVGMTTIDTMNAIVIRHVPAIVEEVERFVKAIDTPNQATQQVLIDTRIVELNNSSGLDLGVQWGISGWGSTRDGGVVTYGGTTITGSGQATEGTTTAINPLPFIVNLPLTAGNVATSSFGLGYINRAASMMLDFRLSALEKADRGKILSQPKIMTLNNTKATIKHGAKIPITTPGTTQGTFTTTYIDAAIKMQVTPSIVFGSTENVIYLDLVINKDEPTNEKDILGNPTIHSREAITRVALKDGETIVIGGLRTEKNADGESSVPGLSKIPLLGSLFKRESRSSESQELMIFVTPKIVQSIKQD